MASHDLEYSPVAGSGLAYGLGEAADEVRPGPVPLEGIVRGGRRLRARRRVAVVSAVSAVSVLAAGAVGAAAVFGAAGGDADRVGPGRSEVPSAVGSGRSEVPGGVLGSTTLAQGVFDGVAWELVRTLAVVPAAEVAAQWPAAPLGAEATVVRLTVRYDDGSGSLVGETSSIDPGRPAWKRLYLGTFGATPFEARAGQSAVRGWLVQGRIPGEVAKVVVTAADGTVTVLSGADLIAAPAPEDGSFAVYFAVALPRSEGEARPRVEMYDAAGVPVCCGK
ncbi:hypothetical protein [Yinghuangia soli]|uniref:Uncharacterized protein n=1 Tax=Yinghuangia soli TaxID=2908204 RepID=A0AA41U3W3_9ACTN|nr:hypothetical protein [Yinghuangia soli]MCF2532245.1 hypothetical protein [Yinghuangia soli]